MANLRSQLDALASSFATEIIAVIRSSSLHELVGTNGHQAANGRRSGVVLGGGGQPNPLSVAKKRSKPGRFPRRSAEEIAEMLGKIVLLVKTHKEGMRAEEIRSALGMQSKEMPRILKQGIATKKLTTKGQKRATTYFAAR